LASYIIKNAKEEYVSKLERMEIDTRNEEERRCVKAYEQKREEIDGDVTGNGEETGERGGGTGGCRSSREFKIRDADYIMC
jgi:hypothetical protein